MEVLTAERIDLFLAALVLFTKIQKNDKAAAQAALTEAISTISKATSKGVYHKNNCARKISRLSKAVNSIG